MVLGPLLVSGGLAFATAAAAVVYWDAGRVGVGRARVWAAFVFLTVAVGLTLPVFARSVPLPGVLVILILGPAFYALERDDTLHGDEPSDPRTLPESDGSDDE